ncbi:tetratricopeptide repeat protein [Ensifer sp. T173]|uniref:Tetratricopeptide repeat protein n=1 Tax=Ensifer canadensis TaxID=555315 RepID=A0AAW4FMB8_9HYPH|nr:adenylate/guanylate cyclase domain-containing protein [Ensifer canadensis]MBM3092451.1 tetratricopeptide repeat protein [Ensifer canadensis]UBI73983.1 adenylate/guanylate cyclase domain-containing protein [Ensifer canadensis]
MEVPLFERKLLAILAADIVGYSSAMEADEAGTIVRLRTLRADLIDPAIAGHHGRTVKLMGDGTLVVFDSVVDAVACAAETQKTLASRNAGLTESERLVLRIGINLGDVALLEGDVYGDGVNVAARLEQLCEPGGVMISGTAFDHLQGKVDCTFDFVGEQHVKNILRPVRVYRMRLDGRKARYVRIKMLPRRAMLGALAVIVVLLLAAGAWQFWPTAVVSAKPSIAVLPFDDYGGDAATARLADGLTEDVITDLSRIREFDVIARNSTELYKGKSADVRQIGRDLNVRYVLEGSIQRQGDRIRATAQLIDTASGSHVWSEKWDRHVQDFFAIQSEIANHIVGQLEMTTGPIKSVDLGVARRKQPQNLTAYELTLLGIEKQLSPTRESIAESTEILKKAVAIDPGYARAWSSLAESYSMAANFGADWDQSYEAAMEAAERGVSLDPNDDATHSALGEILAQNGEFGRAKTELDIALRLNPGSFTVLTYYLSWASAFGEPALGAELADRAVRLNPNYKPWASGGLRYAYFMAGRYEDALKVMERQTPDNYSKYAWVERAGSLAVLGRKAEAEATVKEALRRHPDLTIETIANDKAFSAAETQRHIETMRLAGFPPCATPEALAKLDKPLRLDECSADQHKPSERP